MLVQFLFIKQCVNIFYIFLSTSFLRDGVVCAPFNILEPKFFDRSHCASLATNRKAASQATPHIVKELTHDPYM